MSAGTTPAATVVCIGGPMHGRVLALQANVSRVCVYASSEVTLDDMPDPTVAAVRDVAYILREHSRLGGCLVLEGADLAALHAEDREERWLHVSSDGPSLHVEVILGMVVVDERIRRGLLHYRRSQAHPYCSEPSSPPSCEAEGTTSRVMPYEDVRRLLTQSGFRRDDARWGRADLTFPALLPLDGGRRPRTAPPHRVEPRPWSPLDWMRCRSCDVQWQGGRECWSCGEPGTPGAEPIVGEVGYG